MRNLQLSWLFLMIFLANCFGINVVLVSSQCQSDQQSLLLQIKSSLAYDSQLSVNLSQWSQSTDCCSWGGVECDESGRVIGLDLSNESIFHGIENATGLFNLQHLQSLNLAYNRFNATQIPSWLGNLTNLTYLNLSNTGFAGQIPITISSMARLVTLDLTSLSLLATSSLKLENPSLSVFVQNFAKLEQLYLDGVNISHGNEWCQALSSSLPNLQVLSLSSCSLSGPICSSLANLPSLSVIRLAQNNLSSPVPGFLADFSNLTSLHLSTCQLNGAFPEKIFQVPKLQTLDLSDNNLLQGALSYFPQNLSLQTLMLSGTNFSGTLPNSTGNLKNLSRIDLARCNFTGQIPTSFSNLTQLVFVDLSSNNFTGTVPPFHMSKNLAHLDLSYNFLTGDISSTNWEQLSDLVYVDLGSNALNGSILPPLFSHPSLKQLHLANNQFEGHLLVPTNASTSVLDTLDLSGNRLEGPLPKSVFELKQLSVLLLSSNKFNDTVQLNEIQGLRNLTTIDLSYNNLEVDTSNMDSSSLPKMSKLKLASCKLTEIPDLRNQSKLFHLDLSENQISGEIPNWIWEVGDESLIYLNLSHNLLVGLKEPYNIFNLIVIDLHSNFLRGKIPLPPPTVVYVDYSNNSFSSIPANIGDFLSFAIFFSVSNNNLPGVIPESICNATFLQVLDLSNNNLNGTIPKCLIQTIKTLGVLNLRRNSLTGNIFDTFSRDCGLQTLDLNGNQLEGTVPRSLANCRKLEVLDIGNNQIRGTFPGWLKNVSSLRVLVLRSNNFSGTIGCREMNGSWPMLQIVDLASNHFTGKLPGECLKTWQAMMVDEDEAKHLQFEFLYLSKLYYQDAVTVTSKGLEMELVKILTLFTSIDLSHNNFQGPIPEQIGLFKALYFLNLSHNDLTGPIPSSVGNLRHLESLDLSVNHLSGTIPLQLASLTFLSVLNLSYNRFVGRIPAGNQFATFSSSSFEGNEGLCGFPLLKNCSNTSNLQPSATAPSKEFDWQFIVTGVGFGIGSAAVIAPLMFCNKVNEWYDDGVDKFLIWILPMVGLTYITSHERKVEAEENLENEITDDDDEEMETDCFRGRYCVFCSKLDITWKRVVHDPKCTGHHSPPISSSSSTSSSSSSLAI